MGRDYTLRLPAGDHALHEASRKAINDIPMARRVGQEFRVHGTDGTLRVIKTHRGVSICEGEGGRLYLEAGQHLAELYDSDRCTHCGEFGPLCSCQPVAYDSTLSSENQNEQEHRHPEQPMKPLPFKDLVAKEIKDSISCIEGKVTTLWPSTSGVGQYGEWTLTNGEIEEEGTGLKHPILFTLDIPQNKRGKYLRVTATEGKGGKMVGICMDKDKKGNRQIKVDNRAVITWDVAEPDAGPESHGAISEDRARQSTERAKSTMSFLKAATDHFTFLGRVTALYRQMKEEHGLPEMDGKALDGAAYGIRMDLQNGNGFRSEWLESGTSEKALSEASDAPWGSDDPPPVTTPEKAIPVQKKAPPAEAVKTWKDECHPNGTKFGDAPKSDLQRWCLWAFALQALKGKDAKGKEIGIEPKRMMTSMLTCAVENKWTAQSLLIARLAKTDECQAGKFDDDDIEAYFKEHEVMDIISSDKKEMDDNVASAVEDLITLHQQRSAGQSTEEVQIPE